MDASDKLNKIDKDQAENHKQKQLTKSPSKIEVIKAIEGTACEVNKKTE